MAANESVNCSMEALIDWSTPEVVKNKSYIGNYINNPFDILELQAANMDPFDLVPEQTPLRGDPPCGNILSPLWESKVNRRIQKSVSLTDIHGVAKLLEKNYMDQDKDDFVKNQSKDDCATTECVSTTISDQSIDNNVLVHIGENQTENQEPSIKLVFVPDQNEVDIEKNSYCNEQEKKQIREQTRQRIGILIEKEKKNYEECYSRKSLFCTPKRSNTESNLNKYLNSSVLNRGFIGSFNLNSNSINKTPDNTIDINENITSNDNVEFPFNELNSFDLNSLKPEWVVDNFSDSDGSSDISLVNSVTEIKPTDDNHQVDVKLKTLNRLGIVESKPNGSQTVLKSMQNKRLQSKGPFIANVPVKHMVQNFKDVEKKDVSHGSVSPRKMKPIASSTPTALDIATLAKTPSTAESSIKSRSSLSRRSMPNSGSPGTPLNVTKCIKKNSTNTTVVLFGKANERNSEILRSFKLNKSKSESKIGMIPKPNVMNTTKISGLPVSKRFTMSFKGKENVQTQ